MCRARTGLSSSRLAPQAGTSAWRAVSSASVGMTPRAFFRAKVIPDNDLTPGRSGLFVVSPLPGHMVAGMGGAWGDIEEEGFVRRQGFLLPHPVHRPGGYAVGEVIAILWQGRWIDGGGAVVERGIVLVGFPSDEPIKRPNTTAPRRPASKGPHGAGLPDRHPLAFAKLRR
jgi:hypothetical protein